MFLQRRNKWSNFVYLQVTVQSARWVTAHVGALSVQFSESNRSLLSALVSLLSSSLQVVTSSPETSDSADSPQPLESHLVTGKSGNAFVDDADHCITDLSETKYNKQSEPVPKRLMMRLVNDLLQTTSDLMLVRANIRLMSIYKLYVLVCFVMIL